MHPHRTRARRCTMVGTVLSTSLKENDLGLPFRSNLQVSEQCGIAASKGNHIVALMR